MTDGDKEQQSSGAGTPDINPKDQVDGSAPNANPQQVVDAVADASAAPKVETDTPSDEQETTTTAVESRNLSFRDAWFDDDLEQHPVVVALREAFPDAVHDIVRFRNETTIHVAREEFRNIAFFLRDHPTILLNFLADLTAVDMLRLRTSPRFDVVAQLYSIPNRVRLRLKAGADDGETVPSLVPVWNGANWLEREAYDMFGIIFEGHPNLRRMLLPDEWDEGHPLRKDYPLRGWKEFPVYNTERTVPRVRTRWTGRGV